MSSYLREEWGYKDLVALILAIGVVLDNHQVECAEVDVMSKAQCHVTWPLGTNCIVLVHDIPPSGTVKRLMQAQNKHVPNRVICARAAALRN